MRTVLRGGSFIVKKSYVGMHIYLVALNIYIMLFDITYG